MKLSHAVLLSIPVFISGCAGDFKFGDIRANESAIELASQCKLNDSLQKVDSAMKTGGVAESMGYIVKASILIDRQKSNDTVKQEYINKYNVHDNNEIRKLNNDISKTVDQIRERREKNTGNRECEN